MEKAQIIFFIYAVFALGIIVLSKKPLVWIRDNADLLAPLKQILAILGLSFLAVIDSALLALLLIGMFTYFP